MDKTTPSNVTRRGIMGAAAALGVAAFTRSATVAEAAALKGNINHSICRWCFTSFGSKWSLDELCVIAKQLGCRSVELLGAKDYPTLAEHGLTCAMSSGHSFKVGPNHKAHWDECRQKLIDGIDAAAEFGSPNVITFTGYTKGKDGSDVSPEDGAANCVEFYKSVIGHAEEKGVNLCIEHLNSRDTTHPMKGHPGYQGDHVDYCVDIIKRVGSPRMKLLFDIYHVQIMDGDLIRRIHQIGEYIGHIHTAGNPGRGELDMDQEIEYAPVMKALVDIGYTGFVGHEFIPTRDALGGLKEAIAVCDV
ncbi:MAG: TIM barrel protein [Phycisphaera sp.]|nr:TIM barrel protein [Phycisphaera sp.]